MQSRSTVQTIRPPVTNTLVRTNSRSRGSDVLWRNLWSLTISELVGPALFREGMTVTEGGVCPKQEQNIATAAVVLRARDAIEEKEE